MHHKVSEYYSISYFTQLDGSGGLQKSHCSLWNEHTVKFCIRKQRFENIVLILFKLGKLLFKYSNLLRNSDTVHLKSFKNGIFKSSIPMARMGGGGGGGRGNFQWSPGIHVPFPSGNR